MKVPRQEIGASNVILKPDQIPADEGWTPRKIESILMMVSGMMKEARHFGTPQVIEDKAPKDTGAIPTFEGSPEVNTYLKPADTNNKGVDMKPILTKIAEQLGKVVEQGNGDMTIGELVSTIDIPVKVAHQLLTAYLTTMKD
tara:strand:+ start:111 stop:536 length:426 start_codon:yes stop_codon:yes gene_type:complete